MTDAFHLHADTDPKKHSLLPCMADSNTFNTCMRYLSNNKAPGPDGFPNELLKCLPDSLKNAMHSLFLVVYVRAETPRAWTVSDTVLLHKKGDPHEIKNKRPIALANTTYKLYNRLLASSLTSLTPISRFLSDDQEGFRPGRNTERAIQTWLHVLEDAALTGQDLFVLYTDFSAAFNSIDLDKLLMIMYDTGIPEDAIEAVRSIYQHARTSIKTEHGRTREIPIERGTVQGDTLSPLLFLIFIDPLLRWLRVGGRGYKFQSIKTEHERETHSVAASCYADDLAAATTCAEDMHIQCGKVEAYARWGGMGVNVDKCAVSAILHGHARADASLGTPTSKCYRAKVQRMTQGQFKIDGKAIPVLLPTQAYKYLGVHITLTLDWHEQTAHLQKEIQERANNIVASRATPDQKIRIIKQLLHPAIAYSLSTMAYTSADLAKLDSIISSAARRCYNLPNYMATQGVLAPPEEFGLGLGSVREMQAARAARCLTLSLNETGRLGAATRALLELQVLRNGQPELRHVDRGGQYLVTLRQLAVTQAAGLELTDHGAKFTTPTSCLATLLNTHATQLDLPPRVIQPLLALGLDLPNLVDRNNPKQLISTTALANITGGRARHSHKLALNRLCLALNSLRRTEEDGTPTSRHNWSEHIGTAPLLSHLRQLPPLPGLRELTDPHYIPPALSWGTMKAYQVKRTLKEALGPRPGPTAPGTAQQETPAAQPHRKQARPLYTPWNPPERTRQVSHHELMEKAMELEAEHEETPAPAAEEKQDFIFSSASRYRQATHAFYDLGLGDKREAPAAWTARPPPRQRLGGDALLTKLHGLKQWAPCAAATDGEAPADPRWAPLPPTPDTGPTRLDLCLSVEAGELLVSQDAERPNTPSRATRRARHLRHLSYHLAKWQCQNQLPTRLLEDNKACMHLTSYLHGGSERVKTIRGLVKQRIHCERGTEAEACAALNSARRHVPRPDGSTVLYPPTHTPHLRGIPVGLRSAVGGHPHPPWTARSLQSMWLPPPHCVRPRGHPTHATP